MKTFVGFLALSTLFSPSAFAAGTPEAAFGSGGPKRVESGTLADAPPATATQDPAGPPPAAAPEGGAPLAPTTAQLTAPPPAPASAPPVAPAPDVPSIPAPSSAPANPAASAVADAAPRAPSGPVESHFRVQYDTDTVWHTGPSYDYFSKNDLGVSRGATAGYALYLDPRLTVVPELGFGIEQDSDAGPVLGGTISSSSLDAVRVSGGVSGRYALLSFFEPHLRVASGAERLEARMVPRSGPADVQNSQWSPFLTLGGGFTVHTPGGALRTQQGSFGTLVIGLTAEAGYSFAPSMDLSTAPEHTVGRIPAVDAKLGAVERSGPYLRIAIALRF